MKMEKQEYKEAYEGGVESFISGNFEEAFQKFSNALNITEGIKNDEWSKANENKVLLLRAASALKMGNYQCVLEDCNMIVSSNQSCLLAFFLKGQALSKRGMYEAALKVFVKGKEVEESLLNAYVKSNEGNVEINCKNEALQELYRNEEYNIILNSKQQNFKNDFIMWDAWIQNCSAQIEENASSKQNEVLGAKNISVRHEWTQSLSNVCITFYCKNVPEENLKVQFFENSFFLQFCLPGYADKYTYSIENLYREIIPQESKFKLSPMKVEVFLKKKENGVQWISIENVTNVQNLKSEETSEVKKKDWEKISREYEELLKKEEENDAPNADKLNDFFKDIYAKADDDTRRAMIKSFQTSGGTVLSTNWKDVKDKHYENEITAPKGMEVHKWES